VESNIDRSRKRMDVKALDMLQFHWWDYSDPGYLDALKHMTDLKEEGQELTTFTIVTRSFYTLQAKLCVKFCSNDSHEQW
jgi:aryl-alcohol dehydrogenase-like predicted oxidoreductase